MQIVSARPLCARSGEIILTVRRPMSALPPKADITAGLSESLLCAISRHMQCSKLHSIRWPRPRTNTEAGTTSPSACL